MHPPDDGLDPHGLAPDGAPDWEAFYRDYRKPGYIEGFEITTKLGGGMFGLVFRARRMSIGKDYAIKFLKVDDGEVRRAVLSELEQVKYFAQIDHPNLVSIEDRGEVNGIPFLVMSYAGDETLQKRLQQGGMTREEALHIFVQAARGVQALHDHSLVHFDLKPANIFLKGDVARVGDYGLSKLVSASRNSLSFGRGTPYYMAPEMLQRRGDARSDVYSLGILLYECLYGDVPFRGDSEWEVLRKHETARPEFPATALPSDQEVILRCLEKQAEDRFQSAADLLRALQAPVALGESMMLSRGTYVVPAAPRPVPPPAPESTGSSSSLVATPPPIPGYGSVAASAEVAAGSLGMPFQQGQQQRGFVAFFVRLVFTLIETGVHLAMLPVRAVSSFVSHGFIWLLRLPFRLIGFAARLVGVLLVIALIVLVLVTVFGMLTV